jgi:hypothetical protein
MCSPREVRCNVIEMAVVTQEKPMKIVAPLIIVAATIVCSCTTGKICTDEFRMVMLQVETTGHFPATLDSAFTIRQSNGEKISYPSNTPGFYTVLDDSYLNRIIRSSDQFVFNGYKGGQKVVEETYQIAADQCHIRKVSGKDSVMLQ